MTSSIAPSTPQRFPPLDVTPKQELALLARVLHAEGYDDHLAGHITYKQGDGTFLVNPAGLAWDELCASDVSRIDAKGNQLDGPWEISPAVQLHIVLHEHRDNAGVVVHNHPRWGTIWAGCHRIPPIYDQTSAMYAAPIAMDERYEGPVADTANATEVVRALGDADVALMVNHGVLVIGRDIGQAYTRASALEWRCRNAWHIEALGSGVPMRGEVVQLVGQMMDAGNAYEMYFAVMARRQIRRDPHVLD
jgi:ribulose-5-phosphate 4-epimerase/fuculose-1-phosphate aldolase